jgi:hypothetical protein
MNRKGSIAVAAAAAGILVAGAAASVAVVSASQAVPEPEAITLVVDASAASPEPIAAPAFEPVPLPEIVIASPSNPGQNPVPRTASGESQDSATSSTTPEAVSSISAATAERLVLAEVPGTLVSVAKTTRGGFPSFAVTVMRADGSTATGYVDRADGIIHDWTQTAAPAPAYNDDDDEEGKYSEEGESGSEYEGSDHDGDDD